MCLDKQSLIEWLKQNNYRKMTAEEIIYEIEEGAFDLARSAPESTE